VTPRQKGKKEEEEKKMMSDEENAESLKLKTFQLYHIHKSRTTSRL